MRFRDKDFLFVPDRPVGFFGLLKSDPLRIGAILRESDAITPDQLQQALRRQEQGEKLLGEVLVELGFLDPETLVRALATQFDCPYRDLTKRPPNPELSSAIPEQTARDHGVLPVTENEDHLLVAVTDPRDLSRLDEVRPHVEGPIRPVLVRPTDLRRALDRCYGKAGSAPEAPGEFDRTRVENKRERSGGLNFDPDRTTREAPVEKWVEDLLTEAVKRRASDIHLEPFENKVIVRVRVDGVLHPLNPPPRRQQEAIVSRIKIMADMDIAETRLPQDGRFEWNRSGCRYDFRVSTFPTVHGESVVIRVLGHERLSLRIDRLGMRPDQEDLYERVLGNPGGMVLVTGPTGSGKTTTLFAGLNRINRPDLKIVTLEDPIEYELKGLVQCQINEEVDFTFARGLRSLLRQDPDVCLVGEIRDRETARIALQASLTGHLVLSTLHTSDAAAAVTRFVDMGLPPFLLSSTLRIVIAQRLVRVVCPDCRRSDQPDAGTVKRLGRDPETRRQHRFVTGEGCSRCGQTGYRGRTGVFELLDIDDELQQMIHDRAGESDIRRRAREEGMRSMLDHGWEKASRGTTTLEELVRVAPPSELDAAGDPPTNRRGFSTGGSAERGRTGTG